MWGMSNIQRVPSLKFGGKEIIATFESRYYLTSLDWTGYQSQKLDTISIAIAVVSGMPLTVFITLIMFNIPL